MAREALKQILTEVIEEEGLHALLGCVADACLDIASRLDAEDLDESSDGTPYREASHIVRHCLDNTDYTVL